MLTFQNLIFKLISFWGEKGCLFQQGHDVETGAGTFNPATFLRCLGPEPYNTVYVEPSRRPQDGRYGENPNRLQFFHQLQVIMKPSPADIQAIYLQSLEAIGINLSEHDIRFVHDDWESPTLGAWGLGWEVWMDGMEITQFTYFQQVAGFSMSPISVEITYGLERLCMFLQGVDNFFDMKYNDTLTYGDICKINEVEWSRYNFEASDPEMWKRHFDDFERESQRLVAAHLPIPAYDFVIKASHAFNMLEARGVISVTERTRYIHRVRTLARDVAVAYMQERERVGFPLLKQSSQAKTKVSAQIDYPAFDPPKKSDFLLEIGSEELPAAYIPGALDSLRQNIESLLNQKGISFKTLNVYGSPRRLALVLEEVEDGRAEKRVEKRGPPLSISFDAAGNPTAQGLGFFKSLNLTPMTLSEVEKGGQVRAQNGYLFADLKEEAISTFQILAENLEELILNTHFPKKMRWGSLDIAYARPLKWIVALYGDRIIPVEVAGIRSDRMSFGHPQLCHKTFSLNSPKNYLDELKKHSVLVNPSERKQLILEQLQAIETREGFKALKQERVLNEVLYLTEWPQVVMHSFDPAFLRAPSEVLVCEMVEHQRYFPLADKQGKLVPHFIITAENRVNQTILQNNESVLSARLSDGLFLYEQDLKKTLEDFNEKLKVITFQKDLGTLFEKVKRLIEIASLLQKELKIGDADKIARAALLCKADLASELVGEFPELQGIIGKHYALHQKEEAEVALAIEEHYLPKTEGGALPTSPTGILLSLADKIDNVIGYFSVGLKPTSSSDPYAIRRQTIGIIKIFIDNALPVNLADLLEKASHAFPKLKGHLHLQKSVVEEILAYITTRAKAVLQDYGFEKDEIEAGLQGELLNPYDQLLKTRALHEFRIHADFSKLYEVYRRAKGQLENQPEFNFKPELLREFQEKELAKQLDAIASDWSLSQKDRDYKKAFSLLATLKNPLADLFDHVKILCDEPLIKANRLALLQKVSHHFDLLLDFSKIKN